MVEDSELELLKPWVLENLKDITDAETDVLADYVLALLKYDLPIDELRQTCESQLADFLHENTAIFVEKLMNVFQHKPYLGVAASVTSQASGYLPNEPNGHQTANFNGQSHFRDNFRNDAETSFPSNSYPQNGMWINGQFVPMPSSQGYLPPIGQQQFGSGPSMTRAAWRGGHNVSSGRGRRGRGGSSFDQRRSRSTKPESASSTKLVVEKVPPEFLNEQSLRDYFSQFGTIVDIKINPGSEPVVDIEFENHTQANAAWSSPEPIFNNRFIKIYWKKEHRIVGNNGIKKETASQPVDFESVKQMQEQKQKDFEEKISKKRAHEEKLNQLIEMKNQILEEQAKLLRASGASEEEINEKIKTKSLELELDRLKAKADSMGINSSDYLKAPSIRGAYRGGITKRGSFHPYRGRGVRGGRGGFGFGGFDPSRGNLDLRPKQVLVRPVTQEKDEILRSFVLSIGDFQNVSRVNDTEVILEFKNRQNAESFFRGPKNIPELGDIEKEWYIPPSQNNNSTDGEKLDENMEM